MSVFSNEPAVQSQFSVVMFYSCFKYAKEIGRCLKN